MVKHINGKELQAMLAEGKKVVCDFWAAWCGPCRMLAPVFEKLAEEFSDRAEFVKLNIDEDAETAVSLGVMSIPDVYIFDGQTVIDHNLGYVPEEAMRTFLKNNL